MSEINNGGPAFPCMADGWTRNDAYGLTTRDYFAAKAMQGFMVGVEDFDEDAMAAAAYRMADAMLRARGE